MILDYSDYIEGKHNFLHENFFQPTASAIQSGSYDKEIKKCKYCSNIMSAYSKEINDGGGGYDSVNIIHECLKCGWWYCLDETTIYIGEGDSINDIIYAFGILKKYKPSSKDIPILTLRREFVKRPELLYSLNSTKMELLVRSVFKEFYDCEVKHVGKSNDGGIDLILIRSDEDVIVQVKRRQKPNSTEGVSVIRDLIGAMKLSQKSSGIFVTTAEKFSKPAIDASKRIVELNEVDNIELINQGQFLDIMNLTAKRMERPWTQIKTFANKELRLNN